MQIVIDTSMTEEEILSEIEKSIKAAKLKGLLPVETGEWEALRKERDMKQKNDS